MIYTFKTPETKWLSNMTWVTVVFEDIEYPSVEHGFVAAKFDDKEWKQFCTSPKMSPYDIKAKGKEREKLFPLVDNWEKRSLYVMECLLRSKFNQEPFKSKLIETGNQNIQEGNIWHDIFWGVDITSEPNYGENHLGRLIMKIRDELISNVGKK